MKTVILIAVVAASGIGKRTLISQEALTLCYATASLSPRENSSRSSVTMG